MNTVLASSCASRDHVFIRRLTEVIPDLQIVRITYRELTAKTAFNTSLSGKIKDQVSKERERFHDIMLRKHAFGTFKVPKLAYAAELPSSKINAKEGEDLFRSLDPDILISCDIPILKRNIYSIPKTTAINIHFGIAPSYRGNHTLFWALWNKDYDLVGGTVHKLSAGIDTGDIVGRVYPKLTPGDNEISIEVKTALMLAELCGEVLTYAKSQGSLAGLRQSEKGRMYRLKERTVFKSTFFALRLLLFREIPLREQRIERYYNIEG